MAPSTNMIFYDLRKNKVSDRIFYVSAINVKKQWVFVTDENGFSVREIFGAKKMQFRVSDAVVTVLPFLIVDSDVSYFNKKNDLVFVYKTKSGKWNRKTVRIKLR